MLAQSQYEIKPMIGYVNTKDNVDIQNHKAFGIAVERKTQSIEILDTIEMGLLYSNAKYENNLGKTKILRGFVNGMRYYTLTENMKFYGLVGLGYEDIAKEKIDNESDPFFNYGVGLKYQINNDIALSTDVRHLLKFDGDRNLLVTIGLSIALGETKEMPVKKELDKTKDSDNDGVKDYMDNCPSTHTGIRVDSIGCGLNADDDMDGVQNQNDLCPYTAKGVKVATNGCEELGKIESLHVEFKTNSAKIESIDLSKFDKYVEYLKDVPSAMVLLKAHTDSVGDATYNQKLSQRRAQSVKAKLVQLGIKADRIDTIGYGELRPLVPNDTAANRAKNRRVSAEIITE
jgi:OOP family OmpA-OmpF porin